MNSQEPIAVVGVRGVFARAADEAEFWANSLASLDASSEPPAGRWPLDPASVVAPDGGSDRVPHARGYYLSPFPTSAGLDPIFGLGVLLGEGAVCGVNREGTRPERAGVSLGNIVLPTRGASDGR